MKIAGFQFAGLHCGIKAKTSQKDLGIIYSTQSETVVAGVFTTNRIMAAPVRLCRQNLKSGSGRLVVINSGIANTATGKDGIKDARETARHAARVFGLKQGEIFVSSTGRIGERVPLDKIKAGISRAKRNLSQKNFYRCAQAIMTTDAYAKVAWTKGRLTGKAYTIAVMAKGAGMIAPNMATMLCYVLTDLKITRGVMQTLLKEAVDETLNCLTVDNNTSPNDTVLMLASGLAANRIFQKSSPAYNTVKKKLIHLLDYISLLIAADGEGATRCFRVYVAGAKSPADAKRIARTVANSPLVKTAVFGSDPNWGRILCAAGYSGARIIEDKTTIRIGKTTVFSRGRPRPATKKRVAAYLKNNKLVDIFIDIALGSARAHAYGCDLTYDYVKLNAEYHT